MKKSAEVLVQESILKLIVELIYNQLIPANQGYQMTREYIDEIIDEATGYFNVKLRGSRRDIMIKIHDMLSKDVRFKVYKGQGNLSPLSRNTWFYAVK